MNNTDRNTPSGQGRAMIEWEPGWILSDWKPRLKRMTVQAMRMRKEKTKGTESYGYRIPQAVPVL